MAADVRRQVGMLAIALSLGAVAWPGVAHGASPSNVPSDSDVRWHARYEAARRDLVEGRFRRAAIAFRALALEASDDRDRSFALELARLSIEYAERAEAGHPFGVAEPTSRDDIRSSDELTLLYASSFLYGAGTGVWFLLETQPDTVLTATLPFAAITAAPVIAVATIDGYRKLPRGVPHAISAGLYLGLAQGVWLSAFQHAQSTRIKDSNPTSELRWSPETTVGILWGSATIGALLGGLLGSSLVTTPGRVSFTASTTIWSGVLLGLGSGALLPDDELRQERALGVAGLGINAGIATGLLLAGTVSPSVARVRLIDLIGLAGALASAGFYLSVTNDVDVKLAEGVAAIGAGAGLATGWLVTSRMPKEKPRTTTGTFTLDPVVAPVRGGVTVGIGGSM